MIFYIQKRYQGGIVCVKEGFGKSEKIHECIVSRQGDIQTFEHRIH